MEKDIIIVRLFAWLTAMITIVLLFLGGQWLLNTSVLPVIEFIYEAEGFIRVFDMIISVLFILFLFFFALYLVQWIPEFFKRGKIPYWDAYVGSFICLLFILYVAFEPSVLF